MRAIRKLLCGLGRLHRERAGRLETREPTASSPSSSRTAIASAWPISDSYEYLPRAVRDRPGVTLPVGGYDFETSRRRLTTSASSGAVGQPVARARRRSTTATGRRVASAAGAYEPDAAALGRADLSRSTASTLPQGDFTTHLLGTRVTYTMTPLMFASALVQYNSGSERGQHQRAAPVGVSARQRAVRRVQRGARTRGLRGIPASRRGRSSSR